MESMVLMGSAWFLALFVRTLRERKWPWLALCALSGSGLSAALKDLTQEDGVLIIIGDDWAPIIPYYTKRPEEIDF